MGPAQRGVAVLDRPGIETLRRQAVVGGDADDAQLRTPAVEAAVVEPVGAGDEPATVHPHDGGQRAVDPDRVVDADRELGAIDRRDDVVGRRNLPGAPVMSAMRSIAARDAPSVSVDIGPRTGPAASTSAIWGSSSVPTSIVATLVSDGRTLPSVADDEELADRIREVLGADPDVTEQRAFGGLAFLVAGNMAVATSGHGGLLVRVDPAASDALVAQGTARPMEMRERKMKGWLRVATADLGTQGQLTSWVRTGVRYARTLPAQPS